MCYAESGGMNELGYNLYAITRDKRHLVLAGMFEHPEFQQAMRDKWDVLEARHSNFHIPLMVGTARRAELFKVLFIPLALTFPYTILLEQRVAVSP
jgi:hypothetical protein